MTEGEPRRYARVPVIGASPDDVVGLVHRHDLFVARSDGRADTTLGALARPIHAVPELARLPDVLDEFLRRRKHLFLVVDETDAVEDKRELARKLLNARSRPPRA